MYQLKGYLKSSSTFAKLLLITGLFLFFGLLSVVVASVFGGGNSTSIGTIKMLQLAQSVGFFIIPPFVFAYLNSSTPLALLGLQRKINWLHVGLVLLFMVFIIPAINLLTAFNQQLVLPNALSGLELWMKASEAQMAQLTEKLLNVQQLQGLVFNLFLIAMLPALGEELFFRATLQTTFKQSMNVKMAIWLTAILFSAIHMQFYGFLPRLLLGAFFGYLLFWSDNLWLAIVAHFSNNAIAIIFYYLKFNGYKVPDIDTIGTGNTLWLGYISLILGLAGFFLLKKIIGSNSQIELKE